MFYNNVKEYNRNLNTIHANLTLEKRLEIYKIILTALNDSKALNNFICNIIRDHSEIKKIFDVYALNIRLVGFSVKNKEFRHSYFIQDVFPEIIKPNLAHYRVSYDAWFDREERAKRIEIINKAIAITENKLKTNETV